MYDIPQTEHLLSQRRPGFTLPQPFYNSEEIFEFDMEAIFRTSWLFVAFEIELPKVGSYLAMTIGRTPIILVRGRDNRVRGFFNTCRHRGAQLCSDGKGRTQRIVCPYHQWSFDLDGRLGVARGMDSSFDLAAYGLLPISVETVEGTIYVCLADDPPDFSPFRDAFAPLAAPYRLNDAKIAAEQIIVEKANWKLAMENARECAHCEVGHPDLCLTLVDFFTLDYDKTTDPHILEFVRRLKESSRPVGAVDGDWYSTGHMPLQPGRKSITMDGEYVVRKRLMEETGLGALRWTLQPHCYNVGLEDYIFTFSAMPLGAEETLIHSKWLVHKDATEGVDYSVQELKQLWALTNEQDVALTERNQRGVNSIGYRPGPYIDGAESGCSRFTDWYCAKAQDYIRTYKAASSSAASMARLNHLEHTPV